MWAGLGVDEVRAGRPIMNALVQTPGDTARSLASAAGWRGGAAQSLCGEPPISLASGGCSPGRERVGQLPLSVPTGPAGRSETPRAKTALLRRVGSF